MKLAGPKTQVIDLGGRRVIPGLMDSHTHPIRGGLNYNMELRWDGVPSLADAMRMLKEQVKRTPAPQWVRVVGGFTELQFAEKRMPTLKELNDAAPDTPVFILRLYDRALLNRAALRAVGYTKDTKDLPGSLIERDKNGEPTGMLIAKPNALILYSTLAKGPKLSLDDQMNSTRHFMRELNRLGVTSVIDAGGGFQNYPQDYEVVERLARADQLTIRIAYNLFTQKPKEELADFQGWAKLVKPGQGNDMYRHNGAGEMLVYSAADYEDFREPRPDMPPNMEADLERVVRHLAQVKWPFRLHATYDETIGARARRVREGEQGSAAHGHPLVLRPRRDDPAAEHRPRQGAGRRHRRAAPHGLPGRGLREALRQGDDRGSAADQAHTGGGRAAGRRHRCDARRELQPVGVAFLAGDGQDARRDDDVSEGEPPRPHHRACGCGRKPIPGSRTKRARRARSRPASSPTSRCFRPTT